MEAQLLERENQDRVSVLRRIPTTLVPGMQDVSDLTRAVRATRPAKHDVANELTGATQHDAEHERLSLLFECRPRPSSPRESIEDRRFIHVLHREIAMDIGA